MQKEHILFIVNPISGGKDKSYLASTIASKLDQSKYTYSISFTEYKGHASDLCKASKAETIVAVGGDGTVNEIASCIINTNITLGIIPCGSGDGFARHLGISHDINEALSTILEKNVQRVDTGMINGRHFLCTCGIGLDAEISHDFAASNERGIKNYIEIGLRKFWNYKANYYSIEADNYHFEGSAALITIGNANQWGNNAFITPKASISDHLLDLTIAKPFPFFELPHISLMLISKHINWDPHIITKKSKQITIKINGEVKGHLDGEPIILKGPLKVSVLPNSINVIVPTNKNII